MMCNLLACDVLLVGSSVARGQAAPSGKGWGELLAKELRNKYGFQMVNAAIPGTDTTATLQAMKVALKTCKPCAVVIGLSLANEGLFLARDVSEIDRVRDRFLDGMQKLAETAQASGAMPVIGGVYPNDFYEPVHAQTLRSVEATMRGWTTSRGWKYISFLSALDDGEGRWQRGLSADPSHPNEEGHKAMFDAIDISLFDELVKRT
uniref:SGNH hydrolase-type esterase domain-containing protein n=1 Tax=Chrysotila carterae TaxID=13221 RepID=A0A7S4C1K7_CHRCT